MTTNNFFLIDWDVLDNKLKELIFFPKNIVFKKKNTINNEKGI